MSSSSSKTNNISTYLFIYQLGSHLGVPSGNGHRAGVYDQMEKLFTNRKIHFCSHRNFRDFFLNGKHPLYKRDAHYIWRKKLITMEEDTLLVWRNADTLRYLMLLLFADFEKCHISYYYSTALNRVQKTLKTITNISRYLYSRRPVWPVLIPHKRRN